MPRAEQVDAVVLAFFGGQASPDTREILISGENPLAAKLAATVPDSGSSFMMGNPGSPMTRPPGQRTVPLAKNGAVRPGMARAMGVGQQVQLNGLAQVVGLAIGAPEFQRR